MITTFDPGYKRGNMAWTNRPHLNYLNDQGACLRFNNNQLKYPRFGRNNETFGYPDISGIHSRDDLALITELSQRNGACL